jgi:hypothetical protein
MHRPVPAPAATPVTAAPVLMPPPAQTAPAASGSDLSVPPPMSQAEQQKISIDTQKLATANELVELLNLESQFKSAFDMLAKNMMILAVRDNPNQAEPIRKMVTESVGTALHAHLNEFKTNAAMVYVNVYTLDELQQIILFYKSPVGQKLRQTLPEIMAQTIALNKSLIGTAMKEGTQSLTDQMKQAGMHVPKEMGL